VSQTKKSTLLGNNSSLDEKAVNENRRNIWIQAVDPNSGLHRQKTYQD
jgi:hypothetical protein